MGLADKLDCIAGLFAVGLAPKGSADPFALRRAAIGIVTNLIHAKRSFSLRKGLAERGCAPAGENGRPGDRGRAQRLFLIARA